MLCIWGFHASDLNFEGQFGARGFTEEMRNAVGTTQEGLTDFLAQFPSLFTLDGDQVVLKGFGEGEGKNHLMHIPPTGRQRDYVVGK